MYRNLLIIAALFLVSSMVVAQTPGVKWSKYQKTFSSSTRNEYIYDIKSTSDNGYIFAGTDTGFSYSENAILSMSNTGRGWIAKTDSNGIQAWRKWLSEVHFSALTSVQQTNDGGFVSCGHLRTPSDTSSYAVLKLDAAGNIEWEKLYGGSYDDKAYNIKVTADNGYIIVGYSNSPDGDVVKNHSNSDVWLIKLNAVGDIQWSNTYGGSHIDIGYDVCETGDGGFIVCGSSFSSNGDLSANNGNTDGWVFKIDASGSMQWQKNLGGSQQDVFKSLVRNADNTYTISGYSYSNSGDVSGNHGNADMWVIKIDDLGNLVWSKLFGGSSIDVAMNIDTASNNGTFVCGFTRSGNDGDVNGLAGGSDAWIIRLDTDGNLIWQKCAGTVKDEYGMAIISHSDTEFTLAGFGQPMKQVLFEVDDSDGLIIKLGYANTIRGTLFLDINNNAAKDIGENFFNDAVVKAEKTGYTRSAVPYNGLFNIDVDTGDFVTSVQLNNPYFTTVPVAVPSAFSSYYNVDSFGFAVQAIPGKKDISVNLIPATPARPGFNAIYKIVYTNIGTVDITAGTITLQKDARLSYVSATPTPASVSGNLLTWNYTDLNSLDTATVTVNFTVAIPPAVNMGDTLHSVAWIDPVALDETPNDDTAVLKQRVVGSYDPNDKTEANAGIISPAQVNNGEYLNYLIRFQNTGTDTAFNITVRDTLDDRLDRATLQMITASHPYQLTIEDDHRLSWLFSGILLPDSNINEPASHGYIAYRIKPKNTVVVGDTIHNYASIYFDFNLPVITNNAQTIVFIESALPVNLASFTAKQAGLAVQVNWKTVTENNVKQFEVQRSVNGIEYVTIGIVKANNAPNGSTYAFTDNNPVNGYNHYRLKTVDADDSYEYSTIVLVNMNSDVSIISSIYPNPTSGRVVIKLEGKIKGKVRVQVIDQFGREVYTGQYGQQNTTQLQTTLQLGKLSKGNYILKISVENKTYLHKLLIQ